jgi:hypothetical protein
MRRAPDVIEIGEIAPAEHEAWQGLRELLWPEIPKDELLSERGVILGDPRRNGVFVAKLPNGELVGFVEASLRIGRKAAARVRSVTSRAGTSRPSTGAAGLAAGWSKRRSAGRSRAAAPRWAPTRSSRTQ